MAALPRCGSIPLFQFKLTNDFEDHLFRVLDLDDLKVSYQAEPSALANLNGGKNSRNRNELR